MSHRKPAKKLALVALGQRLRMIRPGKSRCGVRELMRMTGLTRAQIVNLEKTGLVVPKWREYSDLRPERPAVYYSEKEILKALIISDMRHAKFSLQQVRNAVKNLEALGYRLDMHSHLLTDGYDIFVADREEKVIDVLRHNRQMLLLVSIEDQIQKVEKIAS
jgi:DNA-binding transcriptional MerR regulator